MDYSKIIDALGGTKAVAEICHVTDGRVSQWRHEGIPGPHLRYLKLLRPDVFAEDKSREAA
jgi:hypothetical protein